ncbi:MAG TPA: potassium-transporting ATPase subunit KdpA [Desulfobulbaceae bacterium]|nr:potassium-transporting ATPase subunit KdpA [Desulfobulbaceae bacterium]
MNTHEWLYLPSLGLLLTLSAPILGSWMAKALSGERTFLSRFILPVERAVYRFAGIQPEREMHWRTYLISVLVFNGLGFLALLALQMTQRYLPLNPQRLPNVPGWLAFNTAVSFMTNTNWQAYSGESTLSYLTQMAGLGVQNFLSAGTGIAVLLALARGMVRHSAETIGNFWCDITRTALYVLLPLSLVMSLVLVQQGAVQTLAANATAHTIGGATQIIPLGPVASQVAIKQLGTNGGGYFGANSAHPFENPTPLTNFLELFAILLLPAALVFTYGKMTGSKRHGWVLYGSMLFLLSAGVAGALIADKYMQNSMPGLPFEGVETRFGRTTSILWSLFTTAASNGSVNAMHGSMAPLTNLVQMFNMMVGEVIFGGVGSGMYGMILCVILTVFIAGLMVGRTPEYLGKRIGRYTIIWASIGLLLPSAVIMVGTAISCLVPAAAAARLNLGPRGFSELIYAWTSAAENNGSAMAGLNASGTFFTIGLGIAMLVGRFGVIVPALAIAGHLGQSKSVPPSSGTFPTDNTTFAVILISVIVLVGGLTFFPALSLGPIIEHLLLGANRLF